MFQEISDLVRSSGRVNMTITVKGEQMTVVVVPGASDSEGALKQPLVLSASPLELDAEFASVITGFSAAHCSLAEQMEATKAIIDAATKESANKAQKSLSSSAKAKTSEPMRRQGASANGASDEEDGDGIETVVSDETVEERPTTPQAGTDMSSLLF